MESDEDQTIVQTEEDKRRLEREILGEFADEQPDDGATSAD